MKEHMVFSDCSIVSYKDIEQLLKENKELKKQLEIDKNQINYFIEENEKLKKENHYLNRRVKGEIHLGN